MVDADVCPRVGPRAGPYKNENSKLIHYPKFTRVDLGCHPDNLRAFPADYGQGPSRDLASRFKNPEPGFACERRGGAVVIPIGLDLLRGIIAALAESTAPPSSPHPWARPTKMGRRLCHRRRCSRSSFPRRRRITLRCPTGVGACHFAGHSFEAVCPGHLFPCANPTTHHLLAWCLMPTCATVARENATIGIKGCTTPYGFLRGI